jgi:hypothetical protein
MTIIQMAKRYLATTKTGADVTGADVLVRKLIDEAELWRSRYEAGRQAHLSKVKESTRFLDPMDEIAPSLRNIRDHLRTGRFGQREVCEKELTIAADEFERLRAAIYQIWHENGTE